MHGRTLTLPMLLVAVLVPGLAAADPWVSWRGPDQVGVSHETGLVDSFSPEGDHLLWTADVMARGTPLVANGRVYLFGYRGTGADVYEVLDVFDELTGDLIWEKTFRDFVSDNVYNRYSIGSPGLDPVTGDVYLLTTPGLLTSYAPDGTERWQVSMMDAWGRLTFPNGRIGAPILQDDFVIVHAITAAWGAQGPARDRFYAFDKRTGEAVWVSTPGITPKDSSWSTPYVAEHDGHEVMYAGTGCGNIVAVDVRTGDPLWRFPMSVGGVNVSPVVDGHMLYAAHHMQNLDSTLMGRLVAIDLDAPTHAPGPGDEGTTPILDGEKWRRDIAGFSSSPVVKDGILYQLSVTGELWALDAATGATVWSIKIGADALHGAPVWADNRLYVPLPDGSLSIVSAGRDGGKLLHRVQLAGSALGAPAISDGRILIATTEKLYVFGEARPLTAVPPPPPPPTPGKAVAARVRPAEVLLRPGERQPLTVDLLDDHGVIVAQVPAEKAEPWIPPTAKVKSEMDAHFDKGALVANDDATLSAGAWKVWAKGMEGTTRGRTVVGVPFTEDFDSYTLDASSPEGPFAYPPLPWIGARFKWEVREVGGEQVLAKTLTNMLFQRAVTFLGHPEEHDYVLSADVMSDGDKRQMSAVGLVNQRYLIALKANQRVLEVSSNQERLKESVPFVAKAGVWYRLKTQVTVDDEGVAHVKGKVWERGTDEPAAWTIEVDHPGGHTSGSPGIYGFSPRNIHKVYVDDLALTDVEEAP
ncbi:MAG: PQQ-binding-like beta-propeller repeat protein [Alphaproteobacteria bacterium]|nr:PQQ-binding-like beta-propeller repeat protein [Alphaproteobacteria bacterium]